MTLSWRPGTTSNFDYRENWKVLLKALRFADRYRWALVLYSFSIAVSSVLAMIPPLLLRTLIDDTIPHRNNGQAVALLAWVAGLYVLSAAFLYIGGSVGTVTGTRIILDLRTAIFDKIQRMPYNFFIRTQTGTLSSRLNVDILTAQQLFTGEVFSGSIGSLVADILTLGLTLVGVFALNWQIGLITVLLIPLFVLPSRRATRRTDALTKEQLDLFARLTGFLEERLSVAGSLLVKHSGSYRSEIDLYSDHASRLRRNNINITMNTLFFTAALLLLGYAGLIAVYGVGAYLVMSNAMTIGTVVALAAYVARAYQPVSDLASARINIQSAIVSFRRVFEVLDAPIEMPEPAQSKELLPGKGIEFSDVFFAYPRDSEILAVSSLSSYNIPLVRPAGSGDPASEWVLENISCHIPHNTMTAIVGPSGAGKTTFAMLIGRIYDVSSGAVRVGSIDVRDADRDSLRSSIGYVSQDAHFFLDTIRNNLQYRCPEATQEKIERACRAASVHELINSLPGGYDTVMGQGGYRFSGGERQRLALARVLVSDPPYIILDEATAHLDSRTERLVQQALQSALKGRTAVVIAHRLATVLGADQIIVMDKGRIVATGTHEQLLEDSELYQNLFHSQLLGLSPQPGALSRSRLAGRGRCSPRRLHHRVIRWRPALPALASGQAANRLGARGCQHGRRTATGDRRLRSRWARTVKFGSLSRKRARDGARSLQRPDTGLDDTPPSWKRLTACHMMNDVHERRS